MNSRKFCPSLSISLFPLIPLIRSVLFLLFLKAIDFIALLFHVSCPSSPSEREGDRKFFDPGWIHRRRNQKGRKSRKARVVYVTRVTSAPSLSRQKAIVSFVLERHLNEGKGETEKRKNGALAPPDRIQDSIRLAKKRRYDRERYNQNNTTS